MNRRTEKQKSGRTAWQRRRKEKKHVNIKRSSAGDGWRRDLLLDSHTPGRIIYHLVQAKSNQQLDRRRMALTQISSNKCFGGLQKVFEHDSVELNCKMKFAVYLPPKAETEKCPALYWLSGLTCTEQNFISKSGYHQAASEHGLAVIAPDTSPRGCNIKGEDESWDFGTGAGFYVDTTEDPWKTNYRMYSYVMEELPQLTNASFPVDPQRMSICGHSMGDHGVLICALKNPGNYKSVSAFGSNLQPCTLSLGQKSL
uniref:S-formylglutathione hydrolase n=1 Tax=Papio anubis TaxID=9555 RepID=A0A2I3MWP3_PAPAN